MKQLFILALALFVSQCKSNQALDKKWCSSKCDTAGDERHNTDMIYTQLNDSTAAAPVEELMRFPLRFGIIKNSTNDNDITEAKIQRAVNQLNESYQQVGFTFYIHQVDRISSDLHLEDLSKNLYEPYDQFSKQNDLEDIISIYLFEHGNDFCTTSETSISCGKTGGFSYVLSNRTNNIVLSTFDLAERKIVAHEMGHFFGLYHTFEEHQYGKDNLSSADCHLLGDRICDTPADPGSTFEVYVNYSTCEMLGFKNQEGVEYKPLIENFMSYYKPCYLKKYSFTPGQIAMLQMSGYSEFRLKFSR